ncbi:MAG: hypothetical protein JO266_19040 [Acidobacteria bacterium]|nr:hypothetical protein [Acidobacteriota bacterium]
MLRDKIDNDYSWVVLEPDDNNLNRAVDMEVGYVSIDDARADLRGKLHHERNELL